MFFKDGAKQYNILMQGDCVLKIISRGGEPGNSAEDIFQGILGDIIHLTLEPGTLVSENKMAGEYRVSRSVIRTVFTRLNQLGFIDIYPQRGSYVSRIDLEYIKNLLILRSSLEKEVIYEIIYKMEKNRKDALIQVLEDNLKKQARYKNCEKYPEEYSNLDEEFHNLILDSVGKRAVKEIIADRLLHISRYRNFCMAFIGKIDELLEEHGRILEALKLGNMRMVSDSLDIHLGKKILISPEIAKKYEDFFVKPF